MSASRVHVPITIALLTIAGTARAQSPLPLVVPNDNRVPGGVTSDGATALHITARLAGWKPDLNVDSAVTVPAFAESDGVPRIPAPLLRVEQRSMVHGSITNTLADTLVVHGLRAGTVDGDAIVIAPGERREFRFRALNPGTYMYWGTTSGTENPAQRNGRDSQLTGAIVIDPLGVAPDPDERIFVMTVIDILPDTTKPPPHYDIWELGVNGLSWPHSERLEYEVGRTVRWRWINGSYLSHPMHLHGFHYRVTAKGDGTRDTRYAADEIRDVVTELMRAGSTFAMEWTPTRAGNWLFHCHMLAHITPFPARPDSIQEHDSHDVTQHPVQGMAGLVLGVRTFAAAAPHAVMHTTPAQHLRLFAQRGPAGPPLDNRASGYVLQRGAEPRPDSVETPGSTLLLTRGVTTGIAVINRTGEHTTVHWHGMELESVFDGVAGWSGAGSNLAPLIAPGDSFTVAFTPPRAGTYIYHTHMDEGTQLSTGSYGALLVLEPGQRYDSDTDRLIIFGRAVESGKGGEAINGEHTPEPLELRAGTTYRLRLINILPAAPLVIDLSVDSKPLSWRPISKDGADLPAALRTHQPSALSALGVGETYDFEFTPPGPMEAVLTARDGAGGFTLTQRVIVR